MLRKKFGFILLILILVFQYNLKAQEDYEKDSLESLLPYANDIQRADILSGLANCIKNIDTAKAASYAKQALTISTKLNYCKGKANAIITIGILEKNNGNFTDARLHYLKGLQLAQSCKEAAIVAFAYHSLGNLSYLQSEFKKSVQYYIASVKISEKIGDNIKAARTYNNMGSIMTDLGKLDKAEEYFLRSLDLYKGTSDRLIVAEIENNLANIYQNKGYDLKALYHYSNALDVFRERSSSTDISSALNNIGLVYLKRKQHKKALPFLLESYTIDWQLKDPKALILVCSNLLEAYTIANKIDSATYYMNIALNLYKQNKNGVEIASLYESAAEMYGKLNNIHKRDSFLNLKNNINKEYLSKENKNEISLAATEFENERKEQRLKLMEKENEINQLKISEQEMAIRQRNIMLISAVVALFFLSLIIALLVYLFHINKKSKQFELSSNAKSSILNQLNHEIRTPLNGLVGMSQLAMESKTFAELKEYLSFIKSSGDDLVFVLNNLITFLQLDRNEAKPIISPFDLPGALDELFNIYRVQCKNKGILFNQMVLPSIPKMVYGDKQKILIILQNLLSNAIKQTSKGIIKVEVIQSANRKKDGKKMSTIQFSIIDEGPGLTEKEIKNIFKGSPKNKSKESGFGIGLKNVKELTELMNGHIEVISEKGVGSSFIVELELEESEKTDLQLLSDSQAISNFNPSKYSILIVEDHQVNQYLFSKILEKEGYSCTLTDNGLKGLAALREKNFDLIIMDVRMPMMDGLEAAQLIRNSEEFEKDRNIPIIAISAHEDYHEKKKCVEIGINDYILKPVKKEILLKSVREQIVNSR